jgi:hypothetical protein
MISKTAKLNTVEWWDNWKDKLSRIKSSEGTRFKISGAELNPARGWKIKWWSLIN